MNKTTKIQKKFHKPAYYLTFVFSVVLERGEILDVRWELWEISVLLVALAIAQFVRISCLHFMLRLSSAAGLNLAMLATDFYAIVAGIVFFQYKVKFPLKILYFCIFSFRFFVLIRVTLPLAV
jgi:hypothetical protein